MRSVYSKALLFSIGILVFSLAGFLVISRIITYRMFAEGTQIERNTATQFEEAGLEYENGGAKALASYLGWQHSFYPRLSFYYVRAGRDLVSGEDRTQLLRMAQSRWSVFAVASPIVIAVPPKKLCSIWIIICSYWGRLRSFVGGWLSSLRLR
jgi:hypothetical protein